MNRYIVEAEVGTTGMWEIILDTTDAWHAVARLEQLRRRGREYWCQTEPLLPLSDQLPF